MSITARRLGFPKALEAEGRSMQRIDGAYLYEVGAQLRPLEGIKEETTRKIDLHFPIFPAVRTLTELVTGSVFSHQFKTIHRYAQELLDELKKWQVDWLNTDDFEVPVHDWDIRRLKLSFRKFEATLLAELQTSPLYLAASKGGFDITCLTDHGLTLFPTDLPLKVPQGVEDAKAGARCLAFELFTAAGFHFHRCNEAVLRAYFDEVAGASNRPRTRNIGDYLKKMEQMSVGDPKVIEVLKGLKDLHRNPLMHPEDSIANADEALSLYAAIRAAIGYMLDRIPQPTLPALVATPTPAP